MYGIGRSEKKKSNKKKMKKSIHEIISGFYGKICISDSKKMHNVVY